MAWGSLNPIASRTVPHQPSRPPATTALESAYRYNTDRPVAYLDESYRVERPGATYYLMTAAVVQADQRDIVRHDICEIADGNYWHTTEALRTSQGVTTTRTFLDYLGDPKGTETYFIALEQPIQPTDTTGEQARANCLTELMSTLNSKDSPTGSVDLFVLEERLHRKMINRDAGTKDRAIKSGRIRPGTRLFQTSPSVEQLLWLPDLVCSAYRQQLTKRIPDLFPRINAVCTVLPPKMKQPPAAAATPGVNLSHLTGEEVLLEK